MKVIHVLADGTVKDKIDGHTVKPEIVPDFYRLLVKLNKEALKNE